MAAPASLEWGLALPCRPKVLGLPGVACGESCFARGARPGAQAALGSSFLCPCGITILAPTGTTILRPTLSLAGRCSIPSPRLVTLVGSLVFGLLVEPPPAARSNDTQQTTYFDRTISPIVTSLPACAPTPAPAATSPTPGANAFGNLDLSTLRRLRQAARSLRQLRPLRPAGLPPEERAAVQRVSVQGFDGNTENDHHRHQARRRPDPRSHGQRLPDAPPLPGQRRYREQHRRPSGGDRPPALHLRAAVHRRASTADPTTADFAQFKRPRSSRSS